MVELRELTITDASLIVSALNDQDVIHHLSSKIPQPYREEDALLWINQGSKDKAISRAITFQGEFCGVIGVYLQSFDYQHSAELGYWLTKNLWGKGIASKATLLFTKLLFSSTHITRIYNPVNADNIASIGVMKNAGFTLEGILKQSAYKYGKYNDEHLYALLKEEHDEFKTCNH